MDRAPLGLLGLGAMGSRIAARLLAGGWRLSVYDPDERAVAAALALGAERCAAAAEVAERAEIVLLSLPTPEIVRDVAGELAGGGDIRVCVDLSTTGPAASREIAASLAAAGVGLLDAPVSGGIAGAESGTLTVMAAGSEATLEDVRPMLEELASNVLHVGAEPGMGQLAKVINNLLSATALVASGEAVALGVKEGLDARVLLDVLNASSGRNSATAQKLPDAVLTRSFDFGFALSLMNKDVQLCLREARAAGLDLPVAGAVARAWSEAEGVCPQGADCTEIVALIEQRTGTTITS